mgnify:CR=1 FL=1
MSEEKQNNENVEIQNEQKDGQKDETYYQLRYFAKVKEVLDYITFLHENNVDAVLIGETLMKSDDKKAMISELKNG